MGSKIWTFETLAQASRAALEEALLDSKAPDPRRLAGYVYNGYNHDWLGQLPGKKFRKVFLAKDERFYGLNQIVQQDGNDFTGQWRVRVDNDRPVELGYYRVLSAAESTSNRQVAQYDHLLLLDYNIDPNPKGDRMMRAIRDYVGLPNEGDYDLVLGKAYLQITSFFYIFASYFVLGQREAYK
ncbi:MAG: hypothetical protein HZB51_27310 [Chloroflexi bacterium]|nr:hypothetical protein [Chloroflexota bacterium]